MKNITARADRLRKLMAEAGADAFVIIDDEGTNWESLFYMSGFRGTCGGLVIYPDGAELILDGRYAQQGRAQSPHPVVEMKKDSCADVKESLKKHGAKKVLFESDKTFYSAFESMQDGQAVWFDGSDLIKELRRTKDEDEINCVKLAALIAAKAFYETLNIVKEGMTEKEFETELNCKIQHASGEIGFDMIVASGARGAMPHGRATDKQIRRGEIVTVDYGARFNGYFCDITRNFVIGEPQERAEQLHELILQAHKSAAAMLKQGVDGTEVHNKALAVLETGGVGKYFTHGLGHSFGLEIHEFPVLSSKKSCGLLAGDIVTIEPGVYFEGWGGMRLEDDYLIRDGGAVRLTQALEQKLFKL